MPGMENLYEVAEAVEQTQEVLSGERIAQLQAQLEQAQAAGNVEQINYCSGKLAELTQAAEIAQTEKTSEAQLGYSSKYYEHRMEDAIEDGNKTAYKNARKNYAEKKAKEEAEDL